MSNRRKIKKKKKKKTYKPECMQCAACGWEGLSNELVMRKSELAAAMRAVRAGSASIKVAIRCPVCGHDTPKTLDRKPVTEA